MSQSRPDTYDPNSRASRRRRFMALASRGEVKLCAGCGGVVSLQTNVCPACKGYRWDSNKERIIAAIAHLTRKRRWNEELVS